jgi:uracil-DNA glycosylase
MDAREELRGLVSAFRTRLEWLRSQGVTWVGGARSPRLVVRPQSGEGRSGATKGAAAAVAAPAPVEEQATAAGQPVETGDRAARLQRLREELGECRRCRLGETRRKLVFGVGNPEAELLLVGEAPGRDEDEQGEPFVGPAGQLLTKMIEAMGLGREEVYIANIIKCRPPQNRDPAPDEIGACEQFLLRQLEIIGPRLIIALGNHAAKTLLRTEVGITRLRGRFHAYHGIPLMPTFHPAYLLRNPDEKRPAWQDLKMVMAEMDRLGLKRRR